MKKDKKKELLSYLGYFAIFLVISFGLALFRGADHEKASIQGNYKYTNGEVVESDFLNRKNTIIYYWATWCSVCNANLPLVKFYASFFPMENTQFVSIEEGGDPLQLKRYLLEKDLNFPGIVGDENLLTEWKVQGFPSFYFVNRNGEIEYVDAGIVNPFSFILRLIML